MALYAIGDLHLSFSNNKPMDVFGQHWLNHYKKIEENWDMVVTERDSVLIPGDISWAMTLNEAILDLQWIDKRPGQKILIKGNHDYWWGSITKLNKLFENMHFVQNNFFPYGEYAICGTKGWSAPNDRKITEQDEKIYLREANRLRQSIESASRAGYENFIIMLHYPPTNERFEPSLFTQIIEEFSVEKVIYGHLHGEGSYSCGLKGLYNGVEYCLASCDYLNFDLLRVK
ncbi:metallophosphoesterase [Serpentinicella alkaliphila]|uniref:Calcineurin-like phosphoesterase domain-containing protein n=1 Tax=Serpentinicella alkaliphila TaxID=1734049 RepID=A0A4R2TFE4_9FIRM|nr:metallophosphoesterase [Serpentinicella alkaliphila]QUH25785.1 metallophosphoesterase [Serpentinicella alkaliphila]TCP99784.1 hypothetical protein EDD79_103328 [Serpentinicella alkaliphila]